MTKIQQTLSIEAPLEEIAAYTSDPTSLPEWSKLIERVWDVQPTPEVVGTTWKVQVRVMGAEYQVAARMCAYDPPDRVGIELLGGVPGLPGLTASLDVEARPAHATPDAPASNSTVVTCTLTIGLPARIGGAALGAVLSPLIRDQLRQGMLDLKRALEARRQETGK